MGSYDVQTVSMVMLDEKQCIRHVMTTSLEPRDAVSCALEAARDIKKYSLSDPMSLREVTKLPNPDSFRETIEEPQFKKESSKRFNCVEEERYEPDERPIWKPDMSYKKPSEFPPWQYIGYNLLMNAESGEVKYFGEADLPLMHTLISRSVFWGRYITVQYSTLLYNTIQYSTLLYNTIWYSALLYNILKNSTILYNTPN